MGQRLNLVRFIQLFYLGPYSPYNEGLILILILYLYPTGFKTPFAITC